MKSSLILFLAFTVTAAALPAAAAARTEPDAKPYYYWLHPKLGHVKIDRATNAMLVGKRAVQAEQKRNTR